MLKLLTVWEYQTTLPASWDICMQVKKQQLEPEMEQQTGSKLRKEYVESSCLFNLCAEYVIRPCMWGILSGIFIL